jgi:hypothetical protein
MTISKDVLDLSSKLSAVVTQVGKVVNNMQLVETRVHDVENDMERLNQKLDAIMDLLRTIQQEKATHAVSSFPSSFVVSGIAPPPPPPPPPPSSSFFSSIIHPPRKSLANSTAQPSEKSVTNISPSLNYLDELQKKLEERSARISTTPSPFSE